MRPGFIFGGNTPWTYEELQRKRGEAQSLARSIGSPRNVGEGLSAVGRALAARGINRKADAEEKRLSSEAEKVWGALVGKSPSPARGQAALAAHGGPTNAAATAVNDPGSWEAIQAGIFAGESGGDYDALYGYSQRPGGQFAGVKPTEMTVGQIMDFTEPSGSYGQWVKGKAGRVATPVGAYQIVGRTLRDAVRAGVVSPDEMFTPEVQDRAGKWIHSTQGTGAWEGYQGPQSGGSSMDAILAAAGNPMIMNNPGQAMVVQALLGQAMAPPKQEGITPYQQAQLDMKRQEMEMREAGTWSPGTSVEVNTGSQNPVPGLSKLGEGYTYLYNDDGSIQLDEMGRPMAAPVPGGKADTSEADAKARESKEVSANIVLDEIRIARELIGGQSVLSPATGVTGAAASRIDSTRAGRLKNRLETIKSNIGFDKLQAMRDASPTGGALGQVSEFENRLLQAVFGSLVQAQRGEDLLYNLNRLENIYNRVIHEGIPDEEARRMYHEIATGSQSEEDASQAGAPKVDYSGMTMEDLLSNIPSTEEEARAWNQRWEALQ